MAIKVNFVDNGVYYYSSDFNRQFQNLINKNGLIREDEDFLVRQDFPASLRIEVAKGGAFYKGMYIYSDSYKFFDVPKNDYPNSRNDIVVLSIDTTKGTGEVLYRVGGDDPYIKPELQKNELLIATISVPSSSSAGGSVITENEILMTYDYIFMSKADINSIVNSI